VQLQPTNRRFDFDTRIPRHWHGGRKSVSAFFDNLSIFFPPGERFFIEAVHAYRARVGDEQLLRDVQAFCAQEGFHSREHVRYNALLESRGYPAGELERRVEALLDRVRGRSTKRFRLAVTCALEHFTALMAHPVLDDERTLEGAHPVMAELWRWHAGEEQEHKSVAFDVYQATGGTYGVRVAAMVGATVVFWTKVVEQQIALMRADGTASSPREWLALLHFLFVKPGGLRGVVWRYFTYFDPRFHP
jgi:predicted metal-dependent hydrolase